MNARHLLLLLLGACLIAAGCSGGSKKNAATATAGGALAGGAPTTPLTAAAIRTDAALTTPEIAAKLAPSVVRVQTESASLDAFGRTTPATGVGTGVIIDTDGHIVTNNHVVTVGNGNTAADKITVTLNDQRTAQATIVGRDQPTDLAVLKIDLGNLQPASFGREEDQLVGEDVVAMGYALDLQGGPSVTRGVLSAKGRTIDENPYTIDGALQTDAGINPGNSGGPLVNARAEVIGINTAIIQGAQNVGFAISSALVQPNVQDLIKSGKIDRAYLGVATVAVTPSIARNFSLPVDSGLAVTAVGAGSPADTAGVQTNDVIVKVDGQDVQNNGQLLSILARHRAGDKISIDYYHGSERRTADVTLGSRPGG